MGGQGIYCRLFCACEVALSPFDQAKGRRSNLLRVNSLMWSNLRMGYNYTVISRSRVWTSQSRLAIKWIVDPKMINHHWNSIDSFSDSIIYIIYSLRRVIHILLHQMSSKIGEIPLSKAYINIMTESKCWTFQW